MVKNKAGGNRHKKMARKNVRNTGVSTKIRFAQEGEMYAKVTRIFGQGNVEVQCNDNVMRLCVIRKKFRGRNKRDNHVKINSMILVGLRDWEVIAEGKRPKCDLLCTYSDSQMEQLKQAKGINGAIFPELEKETLEGYEFSNDVDEDINISITKNKDKQNNTNKQNNTDKQNADKFDFDFDDI